MPHSTSDRRTPSRTRVANFKFPNDSSTGLEKFPDHVDTLDEQFRRSPSPNYNGYANQRIPQQDRWQPRRDSRLATIDAVRSSNISNTGGGGHGRQKSLSEAFRNVRTRKGSVSANAHEIADALKAPVSPKLIIMCLIWYSSSALTNTSSKSILNAFPKPATLTLIQFAFVATFCLFFSWLSTVFPALKTHVPALRHGIRYPTREVIMTTIPLAAFQIGGHLLSSTATAKIPVSLVHTIKGLSPLFTVLAYRLIFNIRYPAATYLSLIPLTLGVILACSTSFRGNFMGIIYALLAALIFVTQNIFSKRLFNEAARAEADGLAHTTRKLDKLNLLCYSSGLAFLLTSPIWLWSEGFTLMRDFFHDGSLDLTEKPQSFDHGRLALEFVFNGTFHFGQNIIAFVLLSLVSPVTYSVASLIKRVFVVVIAIIWFQNPTTKIQAAGIALTFFGLYCYDRTSGSNKADRKAKLLDVREESLLPLNTKQTVLSNGNGRITESPVSTSALPSYGYPVNGDEKKNDDANGRQRGSSNAAWLPPGTKQEETWRLRDLNSGVAVT